VPEVPAVARACPGNASGIPGGAREEPEDWSRNSGRRNNKPTEFIILFFKIRFGLIFEIWK
jgi:hypothetical protein